VRLVVPTVTFRLLFVLVVLAHDRRDIVHVAVTDHPTAGWIAQQLRNAFPEDQAPRYFLHDRDGAFAEVATIVASMNIEAVRTAPRSPWQNAYVERLIGSIRRECLDHVIVVNNVGLRRVLASYVAYYMRSRTHLALAKDCPVSRLVQSPSAGRIVATPEVGGLHTATSASPRSLPPSTTVRLKPSSHTRSASPPLAQADFVAVAALLALDVAAATPPTGSSACHSHTDPREKLSLRRESAGWTFREGQPVEQARLINSAARHSGRP
jgi:transposase InsO family protein